MIFSILAGAEPLSGWVNCPWSAGTFALWLVPAGLPLLVLGTETCLLLLDPATRLAPLIRAGAFFTCGAPPGRAKGACALAGWMDIAIPAARARNRTATIAPTKIRLSFR